VLDAHGSGLARSITVPRRFSKQLDLDERRLLALLGSS
jgi:hypothetical protein